VTPEPTAEAVFDRAGLYVILKTTLSPFSDKGLSISLGELLAIGYFALVMKIAVIPT